MKRILTCLVLLPLILGQFPKCFAASEKDFFVVEQSATAANAALARKKALTVARNALSSIVCGKVESVTKSYSEHHSEGISSDALLQETKVTANLILQNVEIADEDVVQEKDKRYTVYIVLKLKKSDFLRTFCEKMAGKQELQGGFKESEFVNLWQKDKN